MVTDKHLTLIMQSVFCGCRIMEVGNYQKIANIFLLSIMGLTIEQIKEKIQKSEKQAQIAKAILHQNKIKFHVQTKLSEQFSAQQNEFFRWVDSLIPYDKANIFKNLFRYPIKTNEITGIIFDKLSRIFDGRNPAFNYQFMTSEQRDDWEWYRQEKLDEPNIWQTTGWEYFKTEINSILIVDLPTEQKSDLPEPYFYWLGIENVINYKLKGSSKAQMEWIIYRVKDDTTDKMKIVVLDDSFYRLYPDTRSFDTSTIPIIETPHELGYCPARFFWDMPLILSEPDVKCHPLSKELAELEYFLFFHYSRKHLQSYASYPIYSAYEQNCDYSTENGDYCDGGFIRDKSKRHKSDSTGLCLQKCPRCGDRRIAGAGSIVDVPIPGKDNFGNDTPDLQTPVRITGADVASLEFNVFEENRLRQEIIDAVCGLDENVINAKAVNEKQVIATFESKNTVLNRVKKGFENAMSWTDETLCRLRYGNNLFVSANVNLGTEFYELSVQTLREIYQKSKEAGASESELDALNQQIIETEYRNNPIELQRIIILEDLEPYNNYSRQEVLDLYSKQLIDEVKLHIKLNFINFVRRFERENINIIEFGSAIDYKNKIDIITKKFIEYANEKININI